MPVATEQILQDARAGAVWAQTAVMSAPMNSASYAVDEEGRFTLETPGT
jgi:hypothetical protein